MAAPSLARARTHLKGGRSGGLQHAVRTLPGRQGRVALAPAGAPRLAAVFRSGLMDLDLGFSSTEGDAANFFVSVSRSQSGFQMTNFQTQ